MDFGVRGLGFEGWGFRFPRLARVILITCLIVFEFGVWGSGVEANIILIICMGFSIWVTFGVGFSVWILGSGVSGLGSGVQSLGFGVGCRGARVEA